MASCKCGAKWSGAVIAHCSACHETFTTPAGFDLHRAAQVEKFNHREVIVKGKKKKTFSQRETRPAGACYPPEESGLVRGERGHWITDKPNPRDWDALNAAKQSKTAGKD